MNPHIVNFRSTPFQWYARIKRQDSGECILNRTIYRLLITKTGSSVLGVTVFLSSTIAIGFAVLKFADISSTTLGKANAVDKYVGRADEIFLLATNANMCSSGFKRASPNSDTLEPMIFNPTDTTPVPVPIVSITKSCFTPADNEDENLSEGHDAPNDVSDCGNVVLYDSREAQNYGIGQLSLQMVEKLPDLDLNGIVFNHYRTKLVVKNARTSSNFSREIELNVTTTQDTHEITGCQDPHSVTNMSQEDGCKRFGGVWDSVKKLCGRGGCPDGQMAVGFEESGVNRGRIKCDRIKMACSVEGVGSGFKYWSATTEKWADSCTFTTCNEILYALNPNSGTCVPKQKACTMEGASAPAYQDLDITTFQYLPACKTSECRSGYELSKVNFCQPLERDCNVPNGQGQQYWNTELQDYGTRTADGGFAKGECRVASCNSGFRISDSHLSCLSDTNCPAQMFTFTQPGPFGLTLNIRCPLPSTTSSYRQSISCQRCIFTACITQEFYFKCTGSNWVRD